jgi:serine/threonine protein kinase
MPSANVCLALCATHRDIKPANILLESRGGLQGAIVRLSDFGFARRLHDPRDGLATLHGTTAGAACSADAPRLTDYVFTRPYRPPEVLLGLPYGYPAGQCRAPTCCRAATAPVGARVRQRFRFAQLLRVVIARVSTTVADFHKSATVIANSSS